jgi:hypothetical protein
MTRTIETLLDMAKHARDSAALHEVHGGEQPEVDHWRGLAARWEDRVIGLAAVSEVSRFHETTQNVLSYLDA